MDIGESIRNLRTYQNITQVELSERTGFSQQHISDIECGKIIPTLATFERILNALNMSIKIDKKD